MVRRASLAHHKAWYVYIVETRTKTLYTGIALDVKKRIKQHTENQGSRYLRGKAPLKLVYLQKCPTKSSALKREIQIKGLSKPQKSLLIRRAQ